MHVNLHQGPQDVIKQHKRVMKHVVNASFNMGTANWLHILWSSCVDRDGWAMPPTLCVRKKFLLWIDHRMMTGSLHLAELSAKILATEWAWSNSRSSRCKDMTWTRILHKILMPVWTPMQKLLLEHSEYLFSAKWKGYCTSKWPMLLLRIMLGS